MAFYTKVIQYSPHKGMFYSNIGDGSTDKIDWCIVIPEMPMSGVVLLKKDLYIIAFDYAKFIRKDFSKALNFNKCKSKDAAYDKFMKWIGKMVKKDYRGRYFNNKVDHPYSYDNESFSEDELIDVSEQVSQASL